VASMNPTDHAGLHINQSIAILAWRENADEAAARWLTSYYQIELMEACIRWFNHCKDLEYLLRRTTKRFLDHLTDSALPIEMIVDQAAREACFEFLGSIANEFEKKHAKAA
jgi:hypothetical protein